MAAPEPPTPYRLVYSEAVKRCLRELSNDAFSRGDGPAFTAALKEFDRLLRIYPQFGDPQIDLEVGGGQIRLGIIRPLSVRYAKKRGHSCFRGRKVAKPEKCQGRMALLCVTTIRITGCGSVLSGRSHRLASPPALPCSPLSLDRLAALFASPRGRKGARDRFTQSSQMKTDP